MSKKYKHWKEAQEESFKERISQKKTKEEETFGEGIVEKKQPIKVVPKTENQKRYIEVINEKQLIFVTSPSGCGKTYIPIGIALSKLADKKIEKLIVTRPMIECGRRIGSLPGEMNDKYSIYVQAIFDNILQFISQDQLNSYISTKQIEFIPLEIMRGCSIRNAFIILDEAQNVDSDQMLMFLTRISENTKVVIAGDLDQTDLAKHIKDFNRDNSGLAHAMRNIGENHLVGKAVMTEKDILRSELVRYILSEWKNGY